MKRFGVGTLGVLLFLLAGCGGNPLLPLTVELVDGVAQPLLPMAAAWRVGPPPSTPGSPWIALPTGQSSWTLPTLANTRFQVAFLCPGTGSTQFYVSLDLRRSELGPHIRVRCPRVFANPLGVVSGSILDTNSIPVPLTGYVASEGGSSSLTNNSSYSLTAISGPGREVGVYGLSGTAVYFGRSGTINLGSSNIVNITVGPVTPTLTLTASLGFTSEASLILNSFVQLPVVSWFASNTTTTTKVVGRPTLSGSDLLQFYTGHGSSHAIWRHDPADPAVAPSASLNLAVPPLSVSGSQVHSSNSLPTFSSFSASGFSPGLTLLGYALFMGEPGIRYWRHFVSTGALGVATNYHLDLETAPGFGGVVPTPGSSVDLRVAALAGSQPATVGPPSTLLGNLLNAKPLPNETLAGYSLVLDRAWPVHIEAATLQSNFIW